MLVIRPKEERLMNHSPGFESLYLRQI